MNPNRLSRELRNLPGNIQSRDLPGGSIISAALDRRLMTWSDRGGASRVFGEIWSEYCWQLLSVEPPSRILSDAVDDAIVLRLDDNPRIALQAGRNKLPNPDFLVLQPNSASIEVRAVDAKFAVDRLRRLQVSPDSIKELVELSGSLVKEEIARRVGRQESADLHYKPGAFLGPSSLINDYYFHRLTTGDDPAIPVEELRLVEVNGEELFSTTEDYPLMRLFQAMDELPDLPASAGVVVGMYYLRLASAARWFETQSRAPLLSLDEPAPVMARETYDAVSARARDGLSAYHLIYQWSETIEKQIKRQEVVRSAARLPVRMSEIRDLLDAAGFAEDKKRIRMVRGSLEGKFMRRLVEETGEIPAETEESTSSIVDRVRTARRRIRPDMMREATTLINRFADEES